MRLLIIICCLLVSKSPGIGMMYSRNGDRIYKLNLRIVEAAFTKKFAAEWRSRITYSLPTDAKSCRAPDRSIASYQVMTNIN